MSDTEESKPTDGVTDLEDNSVRIVYQNKTVEGGTLVETERQYIILLKTNGNLHVLGRGIVNTETLLNNHALTFALPKQEVTPEVIPCDECQH